MRTIKMNVNELEGFAVTIEIKECSLAEYANNFLHIFNNVRENKELVKLENHYGSNDITVYCVASAITSTVNYLENFGTIKSSEKVLLYQLQEPDWNMDKYDAVVIVSDFD